MKIKGKILALVLTALLAAGIFAACGGDHASDSSTEGSGMIIPEGVKAGLICLHDENSPYDRNTINGFREACEGLGLVEGESYFIKKNRGEDEKCYQAALELVDMGCDVIVADSFGHEDYLIQAAMETPDVQFCHITGTKAHTEGVENFHNVFATVYEARYLSGIAAGMKMNEMIETGKITPEQAVLGYIGAYPYAEVKSGYTAFYLGAKSICPSTTMKVTFTNSWYSETLEKTGAQTLIDQGCVLISQHADSMGAPTACETAGVPNIAYDGSTIKACPNTFLISCGINWAPYFEYIIEAVHLGEPIAVDYVGTLQNGGVELSALNEKVAAPGTDEAMNAAAEELINGTLQIFDTANFTVDGKHLTSYKADVDDMRDFEPDTEVIIDGIFRESYFRSAPYFDIDIDGISILGDVS